MSDREEDDVSLEDEIRAAFKDTNAKTDDIDNGEVVDKLEKPRDEKGKFATKEEEDQPPARAEGQEEKPPVKEEPAKPDSDSQVSLNNEKAPTSWSPAVREKWGALPEDVRSEIIRREEASANGVRRLHEEYAPIKRFTEGLAPFIQEAHQNGADPGQYIANVLASERGLRNPDPKQRFSVLLNIAEQYGIPLRDIINQSAGQEVISAPAAPQYAPVDPAIQQQLQEIQRFQQETQQNAFRNEIESFRRDKEFFDDVSSIMANLLDSNSAKDLSDAYDQACWVHPEVRKVLIERERSGSSASALKQRQAAASGASVKSSGAADIKVNGDEDDDSIEDTIRKAMIEASGRV